MNPYVRSHAAIVMHVGHAVDAVVISAVVVVAIRCALASLQLQNNSDYNDGVDAIRHEVDDDNANHVHVQARKECEHVALLLALYARGTLATGSCASCWA